MKQAFFVTAQYRGKFMHTVTHKGMHANLYKQKDGTKQYVHGNIYFNDSQSFREFIDGSVKFELVHV